MIAACWKRMAVLIALFFSSTVMAGSGWTSYGTVVEVYPAEQGVFFVEIAVASTPSTCSVSAWFVNDGSQPGSDRLFSTLPAAFVADKSVRVHVSGDCDQWGYSKITSASAR